MTVHRRPILAAEAFRMGRFLPIPARIAGLLIGVAHFSFSA